MKLSLPRNLFPALRNRTFALYSAGCAVSHVGFWIFRTAIGWLAWELTASGFWLGVLAFAHLMPIVVLGPIGGTAADRWDRIFVVRTCQALSALCALALLALLASGTMTIGLLILLTAFQGTLEAFNQTSQLTLVPLLVDRKDLTSAVATVSVSFNVARFVGPAIAGFLIAGPGMGTAFAVSAAAFAVFVAVLIGIRSSTTITTPPSQLRFAAALVQGLRYALSHPGIGLILLLVVSVGVAGRPVAELLPGFAAEVFDSGPIGLAILTSSVGVGAVLAGLWLGGRTTTVGLSSIMVHCTLGITLSVIAFTAMSRIWLAAPILVLVGFFVAGTGILSQTLINVVADQALRGRVLSLFGMLFRGSPAIGALIMGFFSEYFGLRPPIVVGALLLFLVWVWFFRHGRLTEMPESQ
jgi:MFS family permease